MIRELVRRPSGVGRIFAPRGVFAGWALWELPCRAVVFVLLVDAAAVGALVAALLHDQSGWRSWSYRNVAVFAVLSVCALISVEGSRRLGSPAARRDKPYKDMLSAWTLPVALLLPPVYAVLIPVPVYLAVHYRVTRIAPVKRVFNGAGVAVAGYAAAMTHRWLVGSAGPYGPPQVLGTTRGLAASVAATAVFSAVSACLVAGVLRRVSPSTSRRAALGGWPLQPIEAAELCLGLLVALVSAYRPLLAVLALPPMLLLQQTLLHGELLQAARTDAKTSLANPQYWREVAEREVTRARRGGTPLAVLLVDIDHFKRVNDGHGHLVGDQVLAGVALQLRDAVRPSDLVGRFGGEEFVVLLNDTPPATAARTAERIRAHVQQFDHHLPRTGARLHVTVSVGVAELTHPAQDLTSLLEAADTALYAAKAAGRNQVRTAPRDGTPTPAETTSRN